jgi:Asp-tRNA(Asn)/Glu-tRNA(Gln) amidotransferase A subunit family amidase
MLLPRVTVAQDVRGVARFEVYEASMAELQEALAAQRVTSAELVDAYLARIAAYDQAGPRLNALIRVNPRARAEAAALDAERAAGAVRGPLHGIPILLKDNFDFVGLPTTGASLAFAGLMPPDDGFQVRKLREAGAIVLGKTNLHELAAGILTISSLGGQTLNPYHPARNPGGSSGGTGAAVAASFAALGWGSDTCGSIRIPAAHNALVGLRPTKGLSSIDGVIPLSHSQDVAGPLARTVTDLATALDATIGSDPADPATRALIDRSLPRFGLALRPDALRGARLGVLTGYFGSAAEDREVADIVRRALEQMKAQGAEVIEIAFPGLDSLVSNTSTINHEFKFDLQDYLAATPGAPVSGLGDILERGLHHSALEATFRTRNAVAARETEALKRVRARRDTLHDAVRRRLDGERLDALVYPTIRRKAARIGETQPGANCQLSAATGMPALSAPAGFTNDGLPVGVELLGRRFDDARLVALAFAFEQATHHRKPPRTTPPLVNGAAPVALAFDVVATSSASPLRVSAHFAFGSPGGDQLSFDVDVTGAAADRVHAVVLQRGTVERPGAVVLRLSGPGVTRATGTVQLAAALREELQTGLLQLVLYTADRPGVPSAHVTVTPPR